MGHKILVAFDESENAKRAVDYIAQVFPRDAEITLFSVLQDSAAICEMNSPELTPYFESQKNALQSTGSSRHQGKFRRICVHRREMRNQHTRPFRNRRFKREIRQANCALGCRRLHGGFGCGVLRRS